MSDPSGAAPSRVSVDHVGGVAVVTMRDAARRNVLSREMVRDLVAACDEAESDDATKCIVLVGEGSAFSAGAELSVLEASSNGDFSGIEDVYRGFLRVLSAGLPTIAVVNGPAVGAGLNLALACDLRLAVNGAVFDSRFLALGLIPGGGHTWLLERSVGRETANAMVLFGEKLDAAGALTAGLVWEVFESAEEATIAAVGLGARFEALGSDFAGALSHLCRTAPTKASHAEALDLERYMQRWSTSRPDFLVRVRRMRESVEAKKRPEAHGVIPADATEP
jgi:enoyl-CoA hydratase